MVYLHGGGDSRLSRHPDDSIAASLGVRLLAVDRCGRGIRRPSLRAWAEDLVAGLPVERFAVVGWSAGGPHALAVAAVAPDAVSRVAIVGAMPPHDGVRVLPADVRQAIRLSRYAPRYVARRLERWGRVPVPPTGAPETDAAYARGRLESFREGGLWLAHELAYLGRPWGFDLRTIRTHVSLWWGKDDNVCPPSIARDYERLLPNTTLHLVEGTHQLLFPRWRDILVDVTGSDTSGA